MVKINYSWNAEMRNTEPHADYDRKCEEERDCERGTLDCSKGGTITSDRLIIDLERR